MYFLSRFLNKINITYPSFFMQHIDEIPSSPILKIHVRYYLKPKRNISMSY